MAPRDHSKVSDSEESTNEYGSDSHDQQPPPSGRSSGSGEEGNKPVDAGHISGSGDPPSNTSGHISGSGSGQILEDSQQDDPNSGHLNGSGKTTKQGAPSGSIEEELFNSKTRRRKTKTPKKKSKKSKKQKKSKKKSSKKRKVSTSGSSSSSSSEDESSESNSGSSSSDEEPPRKKKKTNLQARFNFENPNKSKKLDERLVTLMNSQEFRKQAEIDKVILKDHPVPSNVDPLVKLDSWMEAILKETSQTHHYDSRLKAIKFEVDRDSYLKDVESRIRNTNGPLAALQKLSVKAEKGKSIDSSLLSELVDKAIICNTQAKVSLTYSRKRNILGALKASDYNALQTINTHSEEILKGNKEGKLFGDKFFKSMKKQAASGGSQKITDHLVAKPKQKPFQTAQVNKPKPTAGTWDTNKKWESGKGANNQAPGGKQFVNFVYSSHTSIRQSDYGDNTKGRTRGDKSNKHLPNKSKNHIKFAKQTRQHKVESTDKTHSFNSKKRISKCAKTGSNKHIKFANQTRQHKFESFDKTHSFNNKKTIIKFARTNSNKPTEALQSTTSKSKQRNTIQLTNSAPRGSCNKLNQTQRMGCTNDPANPKTRQQHTPNSIKFTASNKCYNAKLRTTSRTDKIPFEPMEIANSRSKHAPNGTGSRIRIHRSTKTTYNSNRVHHGGKPTQGARTRNSQNDSKQNDQRSTKPDRSICIQNICQKRTDKIQTNNKLQTSKRNDKISKIQDGNSCQPKTTNQAKRSDDKDRYERGLYIDPDKLKTGKIPEICVRPENLPGTDIILRNGSSSPPVHQAAENTNLTVAKTADQVDDIHRRHNHLCSITSGNIDGKRHNNLPFGIIRSDYKLQEVVTTAPPSNGVSGSGNRLKNDGHNLTRTENTSHYQNLRTNAQQTSNRGETVIKGDRKTCINGSSNSNRTPLHQEFTKLPQESPFQGSNLRGDHTSQQKSKRGTDMVEKNLEAKPGEITNNHTSRNHNKFRCLSGGLGSSMCKSNSRGEMDTGGKGILATHQCDGDKGSSTSSTNLLQDTSSKISIAQNRQYNNNRIHLQQGRQQEPENERNCQRAMDIRNAKKSPDISGIYTLQTKLGGRQRIQDNRYGRVETLPAAILQDNTNLGSTRNRPVCFKGNKTNTELHQLQTRPTGPSNRCLSNKMAISTSICFPTIQATRPSHEQTSKRQNHWDHNYASMAHLPMVSLTTGKSNSQSNTATKAAGPTAGPSRKPTSNGTKQQIAASGMEGLSRELQNSGISQKTAELMLKSRAPGTTKNYKTS